MPHPPSERQVGLVGPEVGRQVELRGDASVGELVSQLAHEGKELVDVELRRARVVLKDKAGRAVSAVAGGAIALVFLGLASLALAGGLFLVLANALGSYAGAAFATGFLLIVVALVAFLIVRSIMHDLLDVDERDELGPNSNGRSKRGT